MYLLLACMYWNTDVDPPPPPRIYRARQTWPCRCLWAVQILHMFYICFNMASHVKPVKCNSTRGRARNSRRNCRENSWIYRPTTKHLFLDTGRYIHRANGEPPPYVNRSQIPCHPLKNYKKNHTIVIWFSPTTSFQCIQCNSYGNMPFRISRSSALRLKNSDRVIFNLSLLKYDVNFFKLDVKNLQESIKHNFTQVFFCSFLILSTCFIKKIYFSLVIGSYIYTSYRNSYAVAISLMIKCVSL